MSRTAACPGFYMIFFLFFSQYVYAQYIIDRKDRKIALVFNQFEKDRIQCSLPQKPQTQFYVYLDSITVFYDPADKKIKDQKPWRLDKRYVQKNEICRLLYREDSASTAHTRASIKTKYNRCKICTAETLEMGAYRTIEDFYNNSPVDIGNIEMKRNTINTEIKSNYVHETYFLADDRGNLLNDHGYWGVCDGNNVFIKTNYKKNMFGSDQYEIALNFGRYWYFQTIEKVATHAGPSNATPLYKTVIYENVIDINTLKKKHVSGTKKSIKALIEDDDELITELENETEVDENSILIYLDKYCKRLGLYICTTE